MYFNFCCSTFGSLLFISSSQYTEFLSMKASFNNMAHPDCLKSKHFTNFLLPSKSIADPPPSPHNLPELNRLWLYLRCGARGRETQAYLTSQPPPVTASSRLIDPVWTCLICLKVKVSVWINCPITQAEEKLSNTGWANCSRSPVCHGTQIFSFDYRVGLVLPHSLCANAMLIRKTTSVVVKRCI